MDDDLSLFLFPDKLQADLDEMERLHRGSAGAPGALFASVVAATAIAEAQLAPFHGYSKLDSLLTVHSGPPPGSPSWRMERETRAELRRKSGGWALVSLIRASASGKAYARLACAPFELLASSGQIARGACADLFLRQLEAGMFPIDQPLPGAIASATHREPLNALAFSSMLARSDWIAKLLALGADPHFHGSYGKTALHLCAASAHIDRSTECARILLAAGADPRALSTSGKTPAASLHSANRSTATGELLIGAASAALEAKRIGQAAKGSPAAEKSQPRTTARPRSRL